MNVPKKPDLFSTPPPNALGLLTVDLNLLMAMAGYGPNARDWLHKEGRIYGDYLRLFGAPYEPCSVVQVQLVAISLISQARAWVQEIVPMVRLSNWEVFQLWQYSLQDKFKIMKFDLCDKILILEQKGSMSLPNTIWGNYQVFGTADDVVIQTLTDGDLVEWVHKVIFVTPGVVHTACGDTSGVNPKFNTLYIVF